MPDNAGGADQDGTAGVPHQYTTFFLEDHFFGVDVLQVQEVLQYQQMTPVPLAPAVVRGLINLRGEIVTVVDLRGRLGLPEREPEQLPFNVVVRVQDGAVSLLVDEIGDVQEVSRECYEPPPENLPDAWREMIQGIYKLPGRLLLVLSTEKVLQLQKGE